MLMFSTAAAFESLTLRTALLPTAETRSSASLTRTCIVLSISPKPWVVFLDAEASFDQTWSRFQGPVISDQLRTMGVESPSTSGAEQQVTYRRQSGFLSLDAIPHQLSRISS